MTNVFARLFGRKPDDQPVRDPASLAEPLLKPAIHVIKSTSRSRSHLGGLPNLPPNVAWPEWNGRRLDFLARISISELQQAHLVDWLPASGSLLFFYDLENQPWGYDPKDRGCAHVIHLPDLADPPPQLDRDCEGTPSALPHRDVLFRKVLVLPSWEHESVSSLMLSDKESDALCEFADAFFHEQPKHQVSGYAAPVQSDGMELECQLVTHGLYCGNASGYEDPRADALRAGADNWRLLLQLDSDDELGVMWGDAGCIYYWVEEDAARRGDFSNTWLVLQCC
jgi:uncharacterized protein YwqG